MYYCYDIQSYPFIVWRQGGAAARHSTSVAEKPAKQGNVAYAASGMFVSVVLSL